MISIETVVDFLAQKRIAVVGVSQTKESPANVIFRKLQSAGYEVFAVNPKMKHVGDSHEVPDLGAISGGVDGVVIVTRPEVAEEIVRQCAELQIPRVWMHRSLNFLGTSVSDAALEFCKEHKISVIAGGCPMMFCEPVDVAHKCLRWWLLKTGVLQKTI